MISSPVLGEEELWEWDKMTFLGKAKNLYSKFKDDDKGTVAVTWAASLGTIIIAVGASYDLTTLHTAKQKAQHSADMFALAAATQIRDLGAVPTTIDEGFVDGREYLLSDFGLDINPYTKIIRDEDGNIISEPSFTVKYGVPEADMLTVTVNGIAQPTFMSIAGVDALPYEVKTVTSYQKEDLKDPASVLFILDNSGSMGWDENGNRNKPESQQRIYALKQTLNKFHAKMEGLTSKTPDVLRTGLYAFSSPNYYKNMKTETYSCTKERSVVVGTEQYVSGQEKVKTGQEWVVVDYDREVTGTTQERQKVCVAKTNSNKHNSKCNRTDSSRKGRYEWQWVTVDQYSDVPVYGWEDQYEWVDVYSTRDIWGTEEYETTCQRTVPDYITDDEGIVISTKTDPQWDMFDDAVITQLSDYSSTDPRGALERALTKMNLEDAAHKAKDPEATPLKYVIIMTDGAISVSGSDSQADTEARADCKALRDADVHVYAIGYAITTNSSPDKFLKACASPGAYVLASNSAALDAAFDKIGDDILEDVIRIQS